jgi:hypothetical protein
MWIFNRNKENRKTIETVAEMKAEMDGMKERVESFQQHINSEFETIKDHFNSLVHYLDEGNSEENETDATQDDILPSLTETDVQNMKQDILYMRRGITDILDWIQTVNIEFKTTRDHIDGAQKDIKNKIAYSISRLKT